MNQLPSETTRAGCEKAISLITDYLSGDLDADLAARFERHLSQCQECLAYLNTYRQTLQFMRQIADEGLSSDVQSRVWELISRHEPFPAALDDILVEALGR